ncbi:hypothetical protein ACFL1N_10225 [Thermodesulfobacteriota bacterium]
MGLIKKSSLIILSLFFFLPAISFADILDEELPKDTPLQIKEKARQVIRLGVENKGVVKMTQTMLQNSFSNREMLDAYEILAEAKKNGLPEDPIMNKLHEGVGKQVKSGNIIMAMEKVQARYKTAGDLAQRMTRDREQSRNMTEDIAEAMTAGMDSSDVEKIGEMLKTRTKEQSGKGTTELAEQTFKTVKTMARIGIESESTAGVIEDALRKGYDPDKMTKLKNAFIVQARTRANPSELANYFSHSIRAGVSVDDLSQPGSMNSGNAMRNGNTAGNFGGYNGAAQGSSMGSGGSGGFGGSSGGGGGGGAGGSGGGGGGGGRSGGGGGGRGR